MIRRTLALALTLSSALTLGCDFVEAYFSDEPRSGEGPVTVAEACTRLEAVVGEPADRCVKEMGAFLDQCPDMSTAVLTCMAASGTADAMQACTAPCMSAGADQLGPPVPAHLDTPALADACRNISRMSGGSTPAGNEACRRMIAQDLSRCPDAVDEVLRCHAKATTEDQITDCMVVCMEAEIRASLAQEERPEEAAKGKGKGKGKGKRRRRPKSG